MAAATDHNWSGKCKEIIDDLGVASIGGGTMEINNGGHAGESPGCSYHPGNDGKGYVQLLTKGTDNPTCRDPFRSGTSRRQVCACRPK